MPRPFSLRIFPSEASTSLRRIQNHFISRKEARKGNSLRRFLTNRFARHARVVFSRSKSLPQRYAVLPWSLLADCTYIFKISRSNAARVAVPRSAFLFYAECVCRDVNVSSGARLNGAKTVKKELVNAGSLCAVYGFCITLNTQDIFV